MVQKGILTRYLFNTPGNAFHSGRDQPNLIHRTYPTSSTCAPIPTSEPPITSNDYNNWLIDHTWALVPVQGIVGKFLATFKEYPPRAKAASFTVDQALETLQKGHGG